MPGQPDLAPGESSEWVLYLQQLLNQHYQQTVVAEDGTFDEVTAGAVQHFREQQGLGASTHVDASMWDVLDRAGGGPSGDGVAGEAASFTGGGGEGGAPATGNDGAEGAGPGGPTEDVPSTDEEVSSTDRGLTSEEVAAAASVFEGTLATDGIILSEGGPLAVGGYARTLPDYVTFPEGTLTNPPSSFMKWLIHELGHCWQYQQGASVPGLIWSALGGDYDYGGEQGLRDAAAAGQAFADFGYEEQAEIFADYYERIGGDTSAYEPYIRSVREGTWRSAPTVP